MAENTELNFTQTPCAACEQISTTNESMIGCDGCESWYHCRCVGITAGMRLEEKWFCDRETCKALAYKNEKEKGAKRKNTSKKIASDSERAVQQRLKEMKENQKRLEVAMEAELMLKKRERQLKRTLEKKRMLLEQQMREEEEKEELALQEQILRERKMQLDRLQAKVDSNVGGSDVHPLENKNTPLRNPEVKGRQNPKKLHRFAGDESSEEDGYESEEEHSSGEENTDSSDIDYDSKNTKVKEDGKNGSIGREGLGQLQLKPTKAQLAARSDLVGKLPDNDKREWVRYKRGKKRVTLRTFTNFISEIVEEACEANVTLEYKPVTEFRTGKDRQKEKGGLFNHSISENTRASNQERKRQKPCRACQRTDHRLEIVNQWGLCSVCLNEHGMAQSVVGTSAHIRTNNVTLFRMIPVNLHWGDRTITALAFLDEGASVTLVEKNIADRLGVCGVQEKLTIRWTADIIRVEKESRRMNLWVSAVGADDKLLLKSVRTVEKLMLPQQALKSKEIAAQYAYMQGLSITSYDGRPELLIGLNNIHSFAPTEIKVGTETEPIAVRCKLGWTVYGPTRANQFEKEGACLNFHQEVSNEQLYDLLKTHYALEESVVCVPRESAEDKRAREILQRTTKRIGDRFETGLLWKNNDPYFPDSYSLAVKRLKQLEKKLEKNPELYENVCRQIDEYQEKGYAHLATPEELADTEPRKIWYLPLNVVLNPRKPGRVRLIWDAAAAVQNVSLNSQLLTGPDMLVPLVTVIIGFRERRIAFGGDLREMYHQVKIIDDDKQAQPQYVKNCNALEYAGQYPEAVEAIINRHYVDDYFDSVDTVKEAITRTNQVKFIHKCAGFEIRNWVSNSSEVLQSLGEEISATKVHFNQDKITLQERVLGLIWNPEHDEFFFSTQHREATLPYLRGDKRPTKRIVLSCVMGFFDPLGLLAPFTIHGKIIVQHLWRSGCDWDDVISDSCWEMWKRWIGLLVDVENVRVPRCYLGDSVAADAESIEIHIFTDASENAYGSVAYLRAVFKGEVRCCLVMSRAKVAPLKRQSIPRLEFMAAVLGARMSQTILAKHTLKIDRCILWTDSWTVCSWISSDQHKFKQNVVFKVGEILELTRVTDWRWIPTKLNVADLLTKWGRTPFLHSDGEWFKGASFLYNSENQWPSTSIPIEDTDEETRAHVLYHEVIVDNRCSRWTTLLRGTAYVLRFLNNCKRKKNKLPIITMKATETQRKLIKAKHETIQLPLSKEEFQKAESVLWKQAQFDGFPDEMSALMTNITLKPGQEPERITKSSCIYKLTPVLDENGVLRVGGRMETSTDIPFVKRFPIILPRKHGLTRKIIQFYHEKFGHANRETVVNELRQRFWIPNIRAAIIQVMRQCIWCKVNRCRPLAPMMAPLPVQRVTPHLRPFSSIGIDYLGPIEVAVNRRKEKRLVCVFTCLAIRAVHLEVVHSTTQSCLMTIRRFNKEHGIPKEIFSDNATCFKGADREMRRIYSECANTVASATTAWHFNPPAAPHMGGIWERMVRSVKECMKTLDDGRILTDEVLLTVLAEQRI
ncbi:uncharacterized protein LOC129716715 [Wyeomyia smithii]|uniref:uncharacterized protein LOC129716715 n=1 Tax=Wyeomyia smithii TaxID=174621 RepID=UPI002468217F|nr:uncharacterized protein LOC129716715 [Wyeomyia smithii]